MDLFLPATHSLKEKRQILRKLMEKTFQRFKVPVAEVGHQDLWQRASIGFALVGSDRTLLASLMDQMVLSIEEMDVAQVTDHSKDIVDFE